MSLDLRLLQNAGTNYRLLESGTGRRLLESSTTGDTAGIRGKFASSPPIAPAVQISNPGTIRPAIFAPITARTVKA